MLVGTYIAGNSIMKPRPETTAALPASGSYWSMAAHLLAGVHDKGMNFQRSSCKRHIYEQGTEQME